MNRWGVWAHLAVCITLYAVITGWPALRLLDALFFSGIGLMSHWILVDILKSKLRLDLSLQNERPQLTLRPNHRSGTTPDPTANGQVFSRTLYAN